MVLVTAFIFVGVALAEEVTIYKKNWQVQERIREGTIYDRVGKSKGTLQGGKVYDRNWNLEKGGSTERKSILGIGAQRVA